jgi:hypothetical protein
MKSLDFSRYVLSGCAAAAMLVACGGSQPPIGVPGAIPKTSASAAHVERDGSWVLPETKSDDLLYVANASGDYNDVTVYHAKGKDPSPIEVISNGLNAPISDCLDGDGTLYVLNEPAGLGWVSEYPAGKTKPSKVITRGINTPAFCAIDINGNLWVTNIGGQNVTEYEKGSTMPHTIITKGLFYPDGIAIDSSGNMYVANHFTESSGPANVVVYSSGSRSPNRTITDGVVSPVGITVDADRTLYVTNVTENNVKEYRYGQSQPFQSITDSMDEPVAATVDGKEYLYVSNLASNVIVEFPRGSTTPSRREISQGLHTPVGTAYFPPVVP